MTLTMTMNQFESVLETLPSIDTIFQTMESQTIEPNLDEIPEICYWLDDEKRILIGGMPYDTYTTDELISIGIDVFVNLMNGNEMNRYMGFPFQSILSGANKEYIHIPIKNKYILEDDVDLMKRLRNLLDKVEKAGKKIYIFCNAGHGRSGVFSALLLHLLHPEWSYKQVLTHLQQQHRTMKHGGRKQTPQSTSQYNQIHRIVSNQQDIFFHDNVGIHRFLANDFIHSSGRHMFVDDNGEKWQSVEAYYQAQKYMHSEKGREYAKWIQKADRPHKAYLLGQKLMKRMPATNMCVSKEDPISIRQLMYQYAKERSADRVENWEAIRDDVMKKALMYKFTQDRWMKKDLLKTRGKVLVHYTNKDGYWGEFWNSGGENRLGKMLMEIRNIISE